MDFCPIRGAAGTGGWGDALGLNAGVRVPTLVWIVIALVVGVVGKESGTPPPRKRRNGECAVPGCGDGDGGLNGTGWIGSWPPYDQVRSLCSNLKSEDPSPLGMLRCADLLPSSRHRGAWACSWDPGRPVSSPHQGFGPGRLSGQLCTCNPASPQMVR